MIIPKKYAILFWIDNSTGLGNLLKKGVFYDINSMIIVRSSGAMVAHGNLVESLHLI